MNIKDKLIKPIEFMGTLPGIRTVWKPFKGQGCILMYHRVLPATNHAQKLFEKHIIINPDLFEKHIKWLYTTQNIVPIGKLFLEINKNNFPVVITFDDGYRDYLQYALPVMRQYKIPSTVYLTTSLLGTSQLMWWEKLGHFLINIKDLKFTWKGQDFVYNLQSNQQKIAAYKNLRRQILNLNSQAEIDNFLQCLGISSKKQEQRNFLSWDEVKNLDRDPLVTIGSHTEHHLNLAALSKDMAKQEILRGKKILEKFLGHPVCDFAYPYGSRHEAGVREFEVASVFKTAATTQPVPLVLDHPPHELPRQAVSGEDSLSRLQARIYGLRNAFEKIK